MWASLERAGRPAQTVVEIDVCAWNIAYTHRAGDGRNCRFCTQPAATASNVAQCYFLTLNSYDANENNRVKRWPSRTNRKTWLHSIEQTYRNSHKYSIISSSIKTSHETLYIFANERDSIMCSHHTLPSRCLDYISRPRQIRISMIAG
jgi:hypothetical protein